MKKQIQILAILGVLLFASVSTLAQKATRIKFAKGATKAVVTGKFYGYRGEVDYIVRLRKGQTLNVSSNRSVTLTVLNPSGEDVMDRDLSCNGRANISPTVAGDYKIKVVECAKADAWRGAFKLTVKAK